jgi:acetoacetyl-CoA synthetase
MRRFEAWLAATHGLRFASYDALWRWSVDQPAAFWRAVWMYFDVPSRQPLAPAPLHHPDPAVLQESASQRMPGAHWFPGMDVNYAAQALRHGPAAHAAGHPAIVWADEPALAAGLLGDVSWPQLHTQVARLALAMQGLGVKPGDRVVAYLGNRPETAVAFLACASIGAVWSVCSPDMGPVAVLDRFRQIQPVLLLATDGYRHGGQAHSRQAVVQTLCNHLPSLQHLLWLPVLAPQAGLGSAPTVPNAVQVHDGWALLNAPQPEEARFTPAWLPFDHPLWIVYSSGTTGLPKPIVHGHGGVLLEALKMGTLHNNLAPSVQAAEDGAAWAALGATPGTATAAATPAPERFFWYSSTGWIMWNCQVAGLLGGTTVCLFDGSPAGTTQPTGWDALWRFAAQARCTFFGAGAAFYASCLKAGVKPQALGDLSALRAIGSTGSPLADDAYRWIWQEMPQRGGRPIWIACISGGTDFAGAFIGGHVDLPMVAGEMQVRCLGAAVQAWSEPDAQGRGQALMDQVGELVCTVPMPSMPLRLWGDDSGQRLHDSYFDMYPGVWRHGDWIRIVPHPEVGAAGAIIYGRSDATINRHGVRMGTAELYRAVEAEPDVLDSLAVDLEFLGQPSCLLLFVVLRDGAVLNEALRQRLRAAIRQALSPRHVPDEMHAVPAIARTLSGKKMELPVKKLLLGHAPDKVLNRDAMANPDAAAWFVAFAARRAAEAAEKSVEPVRDQVPAATKKPR